jgi:hypothetical protein
VTIKATAVTPANKRWSLHRRSLGVPLCGSCKHLSELAITSTLKTFETLPISPAGLLVFKTVHPRHGAVANGLADTPRRLLPEGREQAAPGQRL